MCCIMSTRPHLRVQRPRKYKANFNLSFRLMNPEIIPERLSEARFMSEYRRRRQLGLAVSNYEFLMHPKAKLVYPEETEDELGDSVHRLPDGHERKSIAVYEDTREPSTWSV